MTLFVQQIGLEPDSGNYLIHKKMTQWLPENLDLDTLLQLRPPAFRPFKRDCMVHLLHLITEVASLSDRWVDSSGFVTLNAEKLQTWLQNYKAYLTYLEDNEVIEIDIHFTIGQQSRGYRFTEQYHRGVVPVEITDYTLLKRLRRDASLHPASVKKYSFLAKYFNPKLKIDHDAALHYLNHNDSLSVLQKNAGMLSVHKLQHQEYRFNVDDTGRRCHTNLTMMRRDLRHFVTYDGGSLVAVDLRNAQPFMVCLLLDPTFWKTNSNNSRLFNYHNTFRDLAKSRFLSPQIIDELTSIRSDSHWSFQNRTHNDIGIYIEHVLNGTLYDIVQQCAVDSFQMRPVTRDVAKKEVFYVMYSANNTYTKYKGVIRLLYPSVYGVMQSIKQDDHTKFAVLLQRIETTFMLDKVARRIASERPTMPLFTIHDSIVCPVGKEGYVADVISSEAIQCFGIMPRVKYEYLTPRHD